MKRRLFLKNSALFTGALSLPVMAHASNSETNAEKYLIEWRVYHISRSPGARQKLEKYLTDALIPFLKKRNIKFGAFSEYGRNEPVSLYVLLGYPGRDTYFNSIKDLTEDSEYLTASEAYQSIPPAQAVYTRYETFLLDAFDKTPEVMIPGEKKGLFELRLYESANEDAGKRKIAMFNNEEIELFLKVGINPVFFGKILAGQHMPALLYMVGFKDMADRDAAWEKFSAHPDWATMREKPEYADTVSNIQRIFLVPEPYSQI